MKQNNNDGEASVHTAHSSVTPLAPPHPTSFPHLHVRRSGVLVRSDHRRNQGEVTDQPSPCPLRFPPSILHLTSRIALQGEGGGGRKRVRCVSKKPRRRRVGRDGDAGGSRISAAARTLPADLGRPADHAQHPRQAHANPGPSPSRRSWEAACRSLTAGRRDGTTCAGCRAGAGCRSRGG